MIIEMTKSTKCQGDSDCCHGNHSRCVSSSVIGVVLVHTSTHTDGEHYPKDLETGDTDADSNEDVSVLEGHVKECLLTTLIIEEVSGFAVTLGSVLWIGGLNFLHGSVLVRQYAA